VYLVTKANHIYLDKPKLISPSMPGGAAE
jgi:hypothetical protein